MPSLSTFRPTGRPTQVRAILALSAVISVLLTSVGCYPKPETAAAVSRPVPVRTATVEKRDVQTFFLTTGRTDADPVKIVPRVRGYIEEVCFKPGDIVSEGDILYRIEDFDYQNDVAEAQADLDIAVANEAKTKADYDRETTLKEKGQGFSTQADLDRTLALWHEATGKVSAAKAALAQAQKDLERTVIKSPVHGKINRTEVEKGNLVDGTIGTPTVLTTVMPMNPIYVYFEITDSTFAQLYKNIIETLKAALGEDFDSNAAYDNQDIDAVLKEQGIERVVKFELGLPSDGEGVYPFSGLITYNENQIARNTGSITLRGEIANPDYMIYPGYICKVRVPGKVRTDAVLVKEKAICFDLSDVYVWVLDDKGTAQKRIVTLGSQDGDSRIIESGLSGGETYILDGTQNVRAGSTVQEVTGAAAEETAAQGAVSGGTASATTTADSTAKPASGTTLTPAPTPAEAK